MAALIILSAKHQVIYWVIAKWLKLILIIVLNPYIVFVVLKFFSWDRERALLKNGCSSSPLEKWVLVEPSWKMGARRALLNIEGQLNLSNSTIIFPRTFNHDCLLNGYIICSRTYEKWYYVTVFIVIIVKTMFRFWPRSPSSLNQPRNKGLGPQPQCIYNFIRPGQELG